MDEIDFFLMKKLLENCRFTFRELGEMTNLSVSAVHKRINKLIEDRIIEAFIGRPNIMALKSLLVLIFGISNAKSLDDVSRELGQHENVAGTVIAGGKFFFIVGILRDISELQDYSVFVSKTAQISDPFVGIVNLPYIETPEPLTTMDYKILKTLNKDARKPITDIADDVGLSAKTVRKRLDRMIENNLATFTIQWKPLYGISFITIFNLVLKEGTDIQGTIKYLNQKYTKNLISCFSYSNIPNMITLEIWTITAQQSQKILNELQTEGFKNINPHIGLSGNFYDCWIDQLLRVK